jgi:hypothetical protein
MSATYTVEVKNDDLCVWKKVFEYDTLQEARFKYNFLHQESDPYRVSVGWNARIVKCEVVD